MNRIRPDCNRFQALIAAMYSVRSTSFLLGKLGKSLVRLLVGGVGTWVSEIRVTASVQARAACSPLHSMRRADGGVPRSGRERAHQRFSQFSQEETGRPDTVH